MLVAFKEVSESVFSTKLGPMWREQLSTLKSALETLSSSQGMHLTPKLHVLVVHVEQWVDTKGRLLGKEGESSTHGRECLMARKKSKWRRLSGMLK